MVNRNLIRELDLGDELEQEIDLAMGGSDAADFDVGQAPSLAINSVVEGKILRVDDEFVLVDVGIVVLVLICGTGLLIHRAVG